MSFFHSICMMLKPEMIMAFFDHLGGSRYRLNYGTGTQSLDAIELSLLKRGSRVRPKWFVDVIEWAEFIKTVSAKLGHD